MLKRLIFHAVLPVTLLSGTLVAQEAGRVARPITPANEPVDFQLRESQSSPEIRRQLNTMRQQVAAQGLSFEVGYTTAMNFPLDQITGLIPPSDLPEAMHRRALERTGATMHPLSASLGVCSPTARSFDWRQQQGATPVRDQGSCGSCWAFAANGAFEGALRIKDGITSGLDTSEQDTLDCSIGGDCNGGWWDRAFSYMLASGSAGESSYPYLAQQKPCKRPNVARVFHAADWDYVRSTNVADIKQALCEHGPLAVAITATPLFSAYTGGVFKEPGAPKTINHGVTLIGWNENDHAWIIKNSWGTGWGETAGYGSERGYMRIAYGSNNVGTSGAWVDASTAAELETDSSWRSIAPAGKQTGTDVKTVGAAWENTHRGWNSATTFDDSDAGGWKTAAFNATQLPARPDIRFIWSGASGMAGATPAYFRKQFQLNAVPNTSRLTVMAYDDVLVYINGQLILSDTNKTALLQFLDVTPYLRAGTNLIAVKAHHAPGSKEGLYLSLRVGGHQVVNSAVTLQVKPGTKKTSTNIAGCPANSGYVAKDTWTATLTNNQNSTLTDIFIEIASLNKDNLFLTSSFYQGQYLGTGDAFPVVWQYPDYSEGQLSRGESVDIPFTVCMKSRQAYQLTTNVLAIKMN